MFFKSLVRAAVLTVLRVSTSYSKTSIQSLQNGGVIVCANHVSLLDGIIVAVTSPQPLVFGVDTEFSRRSKVASWGMAAFAKLGFGYVVPVDSQSPYGIRALCKALDRGDSVMIFPEGQISKTGKPLPDRPGVSWLIQHSGATVVRVKISGAERSRFFAKSGLALWPKIKIDY